MKKTAENARIAKEQAYAIYFAANERVSDLAVHALRISERIAVDPTPDRAKALEGVRAELRSAIAAARAAEQTYEKVRG